MLSKINIKRNLSLLIFFLLGVFGLAFFVSAQRLELQYPQIPGVTTPQPGISLQEFARYIYHLSLIIGAIIAFGLFVYGGFLYLISVGRPAKMSEAKDRMLSAILGLLILFGSYVILSTLDPTLTIFQAEQISVPGMPPKQTIQIEPQMPEFCEEIRGYKQETSDLIDFLISRNEWALILSTALIGGGGLYDKFKNLENITEFTCEQTKTYCCAECLTPKPVYCTWGEGELLSPWFQAIIKAAENALSEFAEHNIKELLEAEEAKKLQGTLKRIKGCNLDAATTLYINGQAEKKGILDELNLSPGEAMDFYCCSY